MTQEEISPAAVRWGEMKLECNELKWYKFCFNPYVIMRLQLLNNEKITNRINKILNMWHLIFPNRIRKYIMLS